MQDDTSTLVVRPVIPNLGGMAVPSSFKQFLEGRFHARQEFDPGF